MRGSFARARFVQADVAQHRGRHGQTRVEGINDVEECFLVLLHVLVVSERQSLHRREQRREMAEHSSGLAAHQLHRVGILFLGHQAGAGGDGIAEFKETEFSCRVKNGVFGETREMDHDERRGAREFNAEITIADGVETVA